MTVTSTTPHPPGSIVGIRTTVSNVAVEPEAEVRFIVATKFGGMMTFREPCQDRWLMDTCASTFGPAAPWPFTTRRTRRRPSESTLLLVGVSHLPREKTDSDADATHPLLVPAAARWGSVRRTPKAKLTETRPTNTIRWRFTSLLHQATEMGHADHVARSRPSPVGNAARAIGDRAVLSPSLHALAYTIYVSRYTFRGAGRRHRRDMYSTRAGRDAPDIFSDAP